MRVMALTEKERGLEYETWSWVLNKKRPEPEFINKPKIPERLSEEYLEHRIE